MNIDLFIVTVAIIATTRLAEARGSILAMIQSHCSRVQMLFTQWTAMPIHTAIACHNTRCAVDEVILQSYIAEQFAQPSSPQQAAELLEPACSHHCRAGSR